MQRQCDTCLQYIPGDEPHTCAPPDPRFMNLVRTQGAMLGDLRRSVSAISDRVSRVEHAGDPDRIWIALHLVQEHCAQVTRENRVLRTALGDLSSRLSLIERQQAIHEQAIEALEA